MKKYNAYMPIWFLLILPPLVIFLFAYNLAMSAIGIVLVSILLKMENPFDEYYKNTFKVFGITLITTIYIAILMFLPQSLRGIDFLYENFVYHLEYNPYKGLLSIIYIIFILITSYILTYKMVSKKITKKLNKTEIQKQQANIILTFFLIPYLFFIPSTVFIKPNKSNLDDFKGTILSDNKTVVELLKNLSTTEFLNSYFLETKKEPFTINIYVQNIEGYRKYFEMDATVIFYLIKDVNEVVFHMNNNSYTYTINDINEIFGNVKNKQLAELNDRYSSSYMRNYKYLGRINGYDIYDKNIKDRKTPQIIYTKSDVNYYLDCTNKDDILAVSKNEQLTLSTLLENGKLSTNDLAKSQLEIILAGVNDDENNN